MEEYGPEMTLLATVSLEILALASIIRGSNIILSLWLESPLISCVAAIDCGRLEDITNGFVEFDSTSFGSIASYTCRDGFVLMGKGIRQCRDNGQWSGEEPVCQGLTSCITLNCRSFELRALNCRSFRLSRFLLCCVQR